MASSIKLANIVLDGKLEEYLREWRARGDSLRTMAQQLQRMNVSTDKNQVQRWCDFYGIDTTRVGKADA